MGFTSILKAVGKGVLTVSGLLQNKVVIAAESLIPQKFQPAVSELNQIAAEVATAEAIGEQIKKQMASVPSQPGQPTINTSLAKGQAVLPSVQQILMESQLLAGRKIADSARFTAGCQKILDGMVDVLDSVEHPNG